MADNYLEKKMEEFKAMPSAGVASKNSHKHTAALARLVAANRQCKSFNNKIIVREQHLRELIKFASDSQPEEIQYYPTVNAGEVSAILDFLKNQNPSLLNFENPEKLPKSFILIGSGCSDSNEIYFISGVLSNIITLRATEMGLNGSYAMLEDPKKLAGTLNLEFRPLIAIAIGKGE